MEEFTFLKKLGIKCKYIPKLVITIFLLLFAIESYGQIPMPPENRCTSKDLEVVGARLDLDLCFQCEIDGPTVPVPLILAINNTTGSFRPTFFFSGILEETDANGNVTSIPITDCNDSEGLPSNTITELTFLDINYTCGSTYLLKDLFLAWTDASAVLDSNGNVDDTAKNSCANLTTKTTKIQGQNVLDISPKCGTVPAIEITTPLTGSPQFTNLTCNDDNGPSNDGTASALASGGKAPYTYLWDDPSAQTTATATGLRAGNYKCTITDANLCTFDVFITVSDAPGFSADATGTNVTCNDEDGTSDDGTATANLTGGVAPFSYLWDDGNAQTTATATGLASGTYNVVVTDKNDCKAYASYEVTLPTGFSADATGTDVTCNDEDGTSDDGTATANLTGGVAPFSYLWDDGNAQTTATATGLASGTYNVVVTDKNGCKAYASYEVTLPTGFSADATGTNVTCNDEDGTSDDGTATANLTGGVAPFSYLWDDGNAQTTATATGLASGTYNVVVTDKNGCKAYASYEVTLPTGFSADATGTNVTCNDEDGTSDDGTATANLTGGVAPFSYLWDDGNAQTTATATGLASGTYNVVVTDKNGCKAYASYEVTLPTGFSADATGTNVTCNDEDGTSDDGTATANLTGGVAPFSYLWDDSNAQTTATATGLASGTYNVVVTDKNGCKAYASYEVTLPTGFSADATGTNVTCNDEDGTSDDGTATANLTGGVAPFSYLWDDGNAQTTATATGLASGTYNVVVTDKNGCKAYASYEVTLPTGFSADATGTNVTCNDEDGTSDDGTATANLTGGVAPFSYLWDDGNAQTTATATGLASGTYNVVVTDKNGCKAYASYEVTLPTGFSADATGTDVTCNDEDGTSDDGTATANLTGGVAPFSYLWDDGNAQTTATATGLASGTYNVVVTDKNGCKAYASYEVTLPTGFSADATGTNVTCNDEDGTSDDGTATANLTGGVAPFSYLWDDSNAQTTATATGLASGTYNVVVTDKNGCKAYASYEVTLPTGFSADATGTNVTCNDEDGTSDDGTATANLTGGVAPFSYLWDDGNAQTTATATGLASGTYNVVVTDKNGCKAYASYEVTLPTGFSADATGTNVTCNDEDGTSDDGTATANLTGGVAPFSYLWDDGNAQTTATATGLASGTYNVVVTDKNGCKAYASYEVTLPPQLTVSLDKSFDPKCVAAKDGSIEVTASGGAGPYDIVLSSLGTTVESKNDVVSKYTFTNLGEGFYKVDVTDDNGCTTEKDLIQISDPLPILGTPTPGEETCFLADGTISLSVSGGSGGYTYIWTKQGDANFSSTSKDLTGLSGGTYDCEIKDSNGCIGLVSDVLINSPINCDHIFPTQTDCEAYSDNIDDLSSIVLDAVCLTQDGNLVSNATPGVFFYFGDWTATSTGKVAIDIVQSRDDISVLTPFLVVNASNVKVQTFGACADIKKGTKVDIETDNGKPNGNPTGNVSVSFNAVAGERYVISAKYDVKSLVGSDYGEATYTFGMKTGGGNISGSFGQISTIDCKAPEAATLADETSVLKSSISIEEPGFSVAPVPFNEQLSIRYEFDYTSDVKIQFFDLNGSLLRTYADKQVTNGDETHINIDFALRSNSVYIMRIETDRDSFSKNIMSGN